MTDRRRRLVEGLLVWFATLAILAGLVVLVGARRAQAIEAETGRRVGALAAFFDDPRQHQEPRP